MLSSLCVHLNYTQETRFSILNKHNDASSILTFIRFYITLRYNFFFFNFPFIECSKCVFKFKRCLRIHSILRSMFINSNNSRTKYQNTHHSTIISSIILKRIRMYYYCSFCVRFVLLFLSHSQTFIYIYTYI